MENQNIRFDENSRDLMRTYLSELQNDTIKALAENMVGGMQLPDYSKTHAKASLSWTKGSAVSAE